MSDFDLFNDTSILNQNVADAAILRRGPREFFPFLFILTKRASLWGVLAITAHCLPHSIWSKRPSRSAIAPLYQRNNSLREPMQWSTLLHS